MTTAPFSNALPRTPNPTVWMHYRVYGSAVRHPRGHDFQAWFWIDSATDPPRRVFPRTRIGKVLFATSELAQSAGVAYGLERARGLSREQRI